MDSFLKINRRRVITSKDVRQLRIQYEQTESSRLKEGKQSSTISRPLSETKPLTKMKHVETEI